MKKSLYLGALALLTLASCASEETVEAPKGNAIDFGKAFINNSTRAGEDVTTANISKFFVYGYMKNFSGVVFAGQEVGKNDAGAWTYSPLAYWTPGNAYAFAALTTLDGVTFTPGETFPTADAAFGNIEYDNNGERDLAYAYAFQDAAASGWNKVNFTFSHLLSRVKLTFKNDFTTPNSTFDITDVVVSGDYTKGSIDLSTSTWTPTAASNTAVYTYAMTNGTGVAITGSTVSDYFYFMPVAEGTYTITFKVQVYQNGVKVTDEPVEKTATVKVKLENGNSYNLTASLTETVVNPDATPIEFDVTKVNDWTDATDNGTVTL